MSVVAPRPGDDPPPAASTPSRRRTAPTRRTKVRRTAAFEERLPDRLSLQARDGPRRQTEARAARRGIAGSVLGELPGPGPDDLLVVAICNCLEAHPGRPDGKVGCGSYGALTMRGPEE